MVKRLFTPLPWLSLALFFAGTFLLSQYGFEKMDAMKCGKPHLQALDTIEGCEGYESLRVINSVSFFALGLSLYACIMLRKPPEMRGLPDFWFVSAALWALLAGAFWLMHFPPGGAVRIEDWPKRPNRLLGVAAWMAFSFAASSVSVGLVKWRTSKR